MTTLEICQHGIIKKVCRACSEAEQPLAIKSDIEQLIDKIRELERDKARLDWLEKQTEIVSTDFKYVPGDTTLRQVIDASMNA